MRSDRVQLARFETLIRDKLKLPVTIDEREEFFYLYRVATGKEPQDSVHQTIRREFAEGKTEIIKKIYKAMAERAIQDYSEKLVKYSLTPMHEDFEKQIKILREFIIDLNDI